jgi:hypothetical protein
MNSGKGWSEFPESTAPKRAEVIRGDNGAVTYKVISSSPRLQGSTDWRHHRVDDAQIDEARDERARLALGFGHTAFPGDYRSRAQVDAELAAHDALLKEEPAD